MNILKMLLTCLIVGLLLLARSAAADSVPELFHYRFDGTGTSVPNHASSPPAGTENATIIGGLAQTGADLNFLENGHSLLGNGVSSGSNYVDAQWETQLTGTSWTISFVTENIPSTTTTHYIFGDINAGQFRCFTGGVAGAGNWILRGAFNDVYANGGAATGRTRTTFVYDMPMNEIRSYVNGVLSSTVAQGMVAITGIGPFKVGAYATSLNLPQNSLFDDFRVYNRALTVDEIQAIDTHARVEVSGDGQVIASGDVTPDALDDTDFGAIVVGLDAQHTFTIENTGNADLEIASIDLSGANAADFELLIPVIETLAPGDTTTFDVRFAPSTAGLREATVTVTSNASLDSAYAFAIQGTGLGPQIAVSGAGQSIDSGDTTPSTSDDTEFGMVAVAGGSLEHTFVIANPGALALDITDITLSGAAPGDFSIVAPSIPIAAGDDAELLVQFDPELAGLRSATVTIASNAADHPAFTFDVAGTGTIPGIAVTGNGVPIANGDTTPNALDLTNFGNAVLNGDPVVRSFLVTNPGDAVLSITGATFAGPAASDFTVSQAPAATVAAGDSTIIGITFVAQAIDTRRATLTITSDAPDAPSYSFDIEGWGEMADVQVSKSNFQPHLQSGLDTVYTIQVLNAGPASVSSVRIVDALPANLVDAAWQCVSSPDGLCPNASGGPDIDETTGPLANGALLEYTLVATPVGAPSDFVSNTATVENLDGSDPDTSNNSATDTDPIVPVGIFTDGFESSGKRLLRPRIGS